MRYLFDPAITEYGFFMDGKSGEQIMILSLVFFFLIAVSAYLLGSINSLLYTVVYFHYNLYASALSALLFSFPMQMITIIRWNKNKWESSTVLKKLSWNKRFILLSEFCFYCNVNYYILRSVRKVVIKTAYSIFEFFYNIK